MARKKVITLFNKNHISIVKIENDPTNFGIPRHQVSFRSGNLLKDNELSVFAFREVSTSVIKKAPPRKKYSGSTMIEERVKSPLGFYYTKTTIVPPERNSDITSSTISWNFINGKDRYVLSYPIEYQGNKIGLESRPWEIAGDKSWDDHYVIDLLNEVVKAIEFSKNKSVEGATIDIPNRYFSYKSRYYCCGNLEEVKKSIFKELFGNPDGPKFQTNEEKILSAGFDLKTSFRNM